MNKRLLYIKKTLKEVENVTDLAPVMATKEPFNSKIYTA
jgi:hypothetical protein